MNSFIMNINNPFVRRRRTKPERVCKLNSVMGNGDRTPDKMFLEQALFNTVSLQKISIDYSQKTSNLYMYSYMLTIDVSENAEYVLTIRKPLEMFNMTTKDIYVKNIIIIMFLQKTGLFEEFKFRMNQRLLNGKKSIHMLFNEEGLTELVFKFNTNPLCNRQAEFF